MIGRGFITTFIALAIASLAVIFIYISKQQDGTSTAQIIDNYDVRKLKDGDTILLGADVQSGTVCVLKNNEAIPATGDMDSSLFYMMSHVTAKKGDTLIFNNCLLSLPKEQRN